MKQKIVIQVEVRCDKCRTEALKIAASADGVASVALEGSEKNKVAVVVVGEEVDAAELTRCLRKKVNYASLESVEEVKPKKEDKKEEKKKEDKKEEKKEEKKEVKCMCPICYDPRPRSCEMYQVVYDPSPAHTCSIL